MRAHGIHVGANYIFGLPDETHASMQQTLDPACDLNTEWANFYCAMAYPGSPLYGVANSRGWTDSTHYLPTEVRGPAQSNICDG